MQVFFSILAVCLYMRDIFFLLEDPVYRLVRDAEKERLCLWRKNCHSMRRVAELCARYF